MGTVRNVRGNKNHKGGIFMDVNGIQSVRNKMISNLAAKNTDTSYADTLASAMEKIKNGKSDGSSSTEQLLKKISGGGDSTEKLKESLSAFSGFVKNSALSEKVKKYTEAVTALAEVGKKSLFNKNVLKDSELSKKISVETMKDGVDFTLDVKQLAVPQKNAGKELDLKENAGFNTDRYYFDVTVWDQTTSIAVVIDKTDTNEMVLDKVKAAINNADIGISAEVIGNGNRSKGYLMFGAKDTGKPEKDAEDVFHFTDSGSSKLCQYIGANQIQQKGLDAIFNCNGTEEDTTYPYNSIVIDGNMYVDFKEKTDGPVKVEFDYDYDRLDQAIRNYTDRFNELKLELDKSDNNSLKSFMNTMQLLNTDGKDPLKKVGIGFDVNGTMEYLDGKVGTQDMSVTAKALMTETGYCLKQKSIADNLTSYMERLTGTRRKYYGLKAKKSSLALRQLMQGVSES